MIQYQKKQSILTLSLPYILILVWSICLFFITGEQSLIAHDEGLYASRAKLMFDTGNWLNPWEEAHHKTPGIYWIIALSYKWLGIHETAARLPSIICSLGCTLIVYEIGKIFFHKRIALFSALIINLQFLWFRYSKLVNADHAMIFMILLGILFLLKAEKQNSKILMILSGFCLFFSFIIRSFMIFIPLVALTPYLIFENKRHKHLQNPYFYLGIFMGLVPTVIWLIIISSSYGSTGYTSLVNFAIDIGSNERDKNGILYYFWNISLSSFPWFIFAIIGVFHCFQQPYLKYKLLILGLPLIMLGELSLVSTRLAHYSLITYPFWAILAAVGIDWLIDENRGKINSPKLLFSIISYFLGFLGICFLLISGLILFNYFLQFIKSETDFMKYIFIGLSLGLTWSFLPLIYIQIKSYYKETKYKYMWLITVLIGNWAALIFISSSGLVTNVNPDVKQFVNEPQIADILSHNSLALIGGGKTKVLLKFYTPKINYKIKNVGELKPNNYAFIKSEYMPDLTLSYSNIGYLRDWQLIKTVQVSE